MEFYFRKSVNLGGLRFNVIKTRSWQYTKRTDKNITSTKNIRKIGVYLRE